MKLTLIAHILLFETLRIVNNWSASMHFTFKELSSIYFSIWPFFNSETCDFTITEFSYILCKIFGSLSDCESWFLSRLCLLNSILPVALVLKTEILIFVVICPFSMSLFSNGIYFPYISILLINHFWIWNSFYYLNIYIFFI
jgi:hypothetical protein